MLLPLLGSQTKSKWVGFIGLLPLHRALSSSSMPRVSSLIAQLRASASIDMMHAYLLKTAYLHMLPVANSLLAIYDPSSAAKLFDQMPLRDHVSWTSVIGASLPVQAVALFRRMLLDAVPVDGVVLVVLLRASAATLRDVHLGSSLHAVATRRGLLADVFVANSLVHMYSECLQLRSAREAFDSIAAKNIVSWNTMLSGFLHADRCAEALQFLSRGHGKVQLHLHADATTLAVLLQLCKKLALPSCCCRSVHALALRKLLLLASMPLVNALLDAYAKCGLADHALRLFQLTPLGDRNVVTWSTAIAACAGSGRPHEATAFFVAMREAGQRPNSITMLSLLEACADRAEITASRCAHGVALRSGLASDLGVANAMVDTYGKCGDLAGSRRVFDAMPVKDVLSWNSMIGAFGMNGHASDALALVGEMGAVKPNGVTLLAVLSACAHGGLVREGVDCLERLARECSLHTEEAHLTCIVDMLARAGDVESAAKIAGAAAGPAAWSALLSGCRTRNGIGEVGQEAARRVVELEPDNSAGYLMAAASIVGGIGAMRRTMRTRGVEVIGGYSVAHVAGQEHRFASWDGCHPQRAQVYAMLHLLHCHMMPKPPALSTTTTCHRLHR